VVEEQQSGTKAAVRDWWAANPMTYAADHGVTTYVGRDGTVREVELGSRQFFEQADEVFYRWNEPLHTQSGRFGKIFDYDRCKGSQVLEVGCGMGCMAMNWALHGARVTAVDLNPVAVQQTRRRFESYGYEGDIREADGEALPFDEATFDYVYSWGVLHHSPNTKSAIDDLHRVLRPGGSAGVMLYHRHSLLYWYGVQYVEGFLHMEDQFLSPLELASRYTDGGRQEGNPHTWPVTEHEVREYLFTKFDNVWIRVLGTDVRGVLNQWFPGLGSRLIPRPFLKALARRWGWSLWITGDKVG